MAIRPYRFNDNLQLNESFDQAIVLLFISFHMIIF